MADDQGPDFEPQSRVPGRPQPPRPPPQRQQPDAGRSLSVDITPRQLRVVPGMSETATVSIRYHGSVITELTLSLSGGAAAWTRVAPDVLNVYPDTEAQATLRFDPPRTPASAAGLTDLTLQVYSSTDPTATAVIQRSIDVQAFDELTAEPGGPTHLTGGREGVLPIKVRNRGNRAAHVTVRTTQMGALEVLLSSDVMTLQPGEESTVWVNVRTRPVPGGGTPPIQPFTVVVSSDRSPPVTIDGRFEAAGPAQKAPSKGGRRWLLGLLGAGALVAGAAAAAFALKLPPFDDGVVNPTAPPATATGFTPGPNVTDTPVAVVTDPPQTTEPGEVTDPPDTEETPTDEPTTEAPPPTPFNAIGWELVDRGPFTAVPAVASWEAGRLDLFAPMEDDSIFHASWSGGQFAGSDFVDSFATEYRLAAVSWGPGRIDVFGVGRDDSALYQLSYEGGWSGWQYVGGTYGDFVTPAELSHGPSASSWGPGRLDVFGRSPDGYLLHNWFDGGVWNYWEQLGSSPFIRAPAAVSWNLNQGQPNHIDVVANPGDGDAVYLLGFDDDYPTLWTDWQTLGGGFNSAPAITSWGRNRLDVFGRGTDDLIYQRTYDFGWMPNWTPISLTPMSTGPQAVSWGVGRIDVFAIGADRSIWHRWTDDGVNWLPNP